MPELDDQFTLAYFAARRALKAELRYHEEQAEGMFLPSSQQAAHARIAIRISTELLRLEETHNQVWARLTEVHGPTQATVAHAEELSTALAKELVVATTQEAVLGSVTRFIDAWSQIAGLQQA